MRSFCFKPTREGTSGAEIPLLLIEILAYGSDSALAAEKKASYNGNAISRYTLFFLLSGLSKHPAEDKENSSHETRTSGNKFNNLKSCEV